MEFIRWFTEMENTKPLALVLFFVSFVAIIVYVYFGKKRSERLESYKNIPFEDEDKDEAADDKDSQK